jgi:dihydroorotase-like cyclic amidohydrolase
VSSTLIQGAQGIFTGLPGAAMRAQGAIRIVDGRIAEIGQLAAQPGEKVIDASGCVVYPGLISTRMSSRSSLPAPAAWDCASTATSRRRAQLRAQAARVVARLAA